MLYSVTVAEGLDPDAILAQLERILSSRHFSSSGQLSRLLRFSVTEAVAGNFDKLKESVLGVEVFGREPGFDTRNETVVRVAENRLRERLREYYEELGPTDVVLIALEKGSYVPHFTSRSPEPPSPLEPVPPTARRFSWWALAAAVILALAVFSWLATRRAQPSPASIKVVPLTSYPGVEEYPAFSPDGSRIAFTWNGDAQDQVDLYVKVIGTETPLRLTHTPEQECCVSWAPDGRSIAFLRCPTGAQCPPGNGRQDVIIIPALGGPERHLGSVYPPVNSPYPALAWIPDGKSLIVSDKTSSAEPYSLVLLSTETAEKRQLTPAGSGDTSPAVSPDGKTLAFVRATGKFDNALFVAPVGSDSGSAWKLQGPPRLVVQLDSPLEDPMWTPGSSFLYFASPATSRNPNRSLWRVGVSVEAAAQRVAGVGEIGHHIAISLQGDRLAYSDARNNTSIWRLSLASPANPPERFISSTRADYNPRFSPDGKKIAYQSNRSGEAEIWVCDSDGRNPFRLTSFARAVTGSPRWSPDGNRIAFDSDSGIYVIAEAGGKPTLVTPGDPKANTPSWSQDGNLIYFASDRTGELQVWVAPANGGNARPLTKGGGHSGFESPDGRFFYYAKSPVATSLWRIPVTGGEEVIVAPSLLTRSHLAPTDQGLYFVERPDSAGKKPIKFLRFATGAIERVAELHQELDLGLSVSPDRQWLLFSAAEVQHGDLLMIDGLNTLFRRP